MYYSSKTYGHDLGLSAVFRQHKAHSHCKMLHGYALAVKLEFSAVDLDSRNWVVDFGGLKSFKQWLVDTFDHKHLIAEDDPQKDDLSALAGLGLADPVIVPAVGCEAFAKMIFDKAQAWLKENGYHPRVEVERVTVSEHGANSAAYDGTGFFETVLAEG